MENQTTKLEWYDKKWLVGLLCILFFPVGLYALWKSNTISKGWKIGVTAILAILVIIGFSDDGKENKSVNNESANTVVAATPEMTQEQKDSIAKIEAKAELENRKNQTITAYDITQQYISNEVRADENFKGKSFYVEGTVTDIKKDIMDDIYVILEGAEMLRDVQCYFDDKNTASQLEKGMKVTFYGKCDGLMMNVLMKNCKIAENLKELEKRAQ